ncbi:MAG: outer membrane lipoprotein carrier protein LolA [Bacteroidales bacterium]|nr:outer membrane lipoprotein carrier protein LolA [Bacteroidales bacterium]MCD8394933.1 outer membrane lipoprotein carrier protein LolA [Bacteroidales bacterium]
MKKKLLIFCALCFACLTTSAESFSQDAALKEISAAAAAIKTMQADFVQTKSLKMLGDKMISRGKMLCEQPNRLRWEYTSPYTYTFILNGNRVLVKKKDRSDMIDTSQNAMFREIARIMMNSVLGKCLTDKNDFRATVAQKSGGYIVTLIPQKKEMKQMFTKILLHYNKQQAMVTQVEMYEKNGDSTVIELKNLKKNAPIDAAQFKID